MKISNWYAYLSRRSLEDANCFFFFFSSLHLLVIYIKLAWPFDNINLTDHQVYGTRNLRKEKPNILYRLTTLNSYRKIQNQKLTNCHYVSSFKLLRELKRETFCPIH